MSAGDGKIAPVITRTLRACVAIFLAGQASAAMGAIAGAWSVPQTLSTCAAPLAPRVAFPSESPSIPTGPGAITWVEGTGCGAPRRGAGPTLGVAALGRDDRLTPATSQPLSGSPSGLDAVGASKGSITVAATLAGASPIVELFEGAAPRPLPVARLPSPGGPVSLAHAYLGDSALATVGPGPVIAVRVERYFRSSFGRPLRVPIGPGPVSAVVAAMDYRSDVLLAWQQHGAIYAHMLRASGRAEPTQRVGAAAPDPQLRALVSDNDHGMIAWSTAAGPAPSARTSVRIALSGAGVRFAGSRLVASFPDPQGVARGPGSLALVRLSTENVMLAWTDSEAGTYVVRAAPAVFAGTRPAATLSDPSAQSVLCDLAPGPAAEAVALWRSSPSLDGGRTQLWAARTLIERRGRVGARAAEIVAQAAATGASVAVDPSSDRPVAAWRTLGTRPRVEYAVGLGASAYRPRPPAAVIGHASSPHPLRIVLAAAGAASIAALIALALRRRAVGRRAGDGRTGTRRRRSARIRR
jgi:hypothetical protein